MTYLPKARVLARIVGDVCEVDILARALKFEWQREVDIKRYVV